MRLQMLLVAGAVLWLGPAQAQEADVAAGETLYAESCRNCHGPAGRGMASFPPLLDKDAEFITGRLEQYKAGEKIGPNSLLMIPVAEELSEDDIANVAAYIAANFQ
jgi:cytochrome c553